MHSMKVLQVRDIPDEVHHRLRIAAAERDTSVSDIVRQVLASYTARLPRLGFEPPDFSRIKDDEQ